MAALLPHTARPWRACAFACALYGLFNAPVTHAQQAEAPRPKAAHPSASRTRAPVQAEQRAQFEQAQEGLHAADRESIETAIQTLGLLGSEQSVEPLAARIREGLPPQLLDLAIATLTALGYPSAGPVLFELSDHVRPEVRRRAIEAIVATKPSGAEPVLLHALADDDAQVRSAAAIALGEIGTGRAVPRLFVALDHGNGEAAPAIGKLMPANAARKLADYLGQVAFHHIGSSIAIVIERRDVAESDKLELIARLEEVGTQEVKAYLGALLASSGDALTPAVKRAISNAVQQIAD